MANVTMYEKARRESQLYIMQQILFKFWRLVCSIGILKPKAVTVGDAYNLRISMPFS